MVGGSGVRLGSGRVCAPNVPQVRRRAVGPGEVSRRHVNFHPSRSLNCETQHALENKVKQGFDNMMAAIF